MCNTHPTCWREAVKAQQVKHTTTTTIDATNGRTPSRKIDASVDAAVLLGLPKHATENEQIIDSKILKNNLKIYGKGSDGKMKSVNFYFFLHFFLFIFLQV